MKPDYKLLKPLPGIPEGAIYKYNEVADRYWPQIADAPDLTFTESFIIIHPDWFEKLPERIEIAKLTWETNGFTVKFNKGISTSGKSVPELLTQLFNGELYSIDQICDLYSQYQRRSGDIMTTFADWIKQRNK